jgi:hypothetical protein
VLETAKKDAGLMEGRSNTGVVQKYARYWNERNTKAKLVLNSPYCGLAVWYWYTKAGVDPQVAFSPRAINWKVNCKSPHSFFGLSLKELEDIPKASAIIYKNSWGNHVGLFEKAVLSDIYTYEGNTSTGRAVQKYAKKGEGVFYLKTSVNNKQIRPIYYCDCIKQGKVL